MDNKGLIFIPDISGFTQFVNSTQVEHSRHIIQELLETIINANQIGLEISEIEGDAILFFKYGEAPALKEIYAQVEKMFCEFHRSLVAYDLCRLCQCTACKSASTLSLKIITHYGEFTGYNVKNFSKLIGKDIIVAHQLLKNDIDEHEYWLVTDDLMKDKPQQELPQWMSWDSGSKQTDSRAVPFQYAYLRPLKANLPPPGLTNYEIGDKVKVFTVTREYDEEIGSLFFTALNFDSRNKWQVGVKDIQNVSHTLPQIGTSHCCVLDKGQVVLYSSSFSYKPERIVYSETDSKKRSAVYQTLDKLGDNKTRLTLDFYLKNNFFLLTMFRLFMKKKFYGEFQQSMENLAKFVKEHRMVEALS